jgi:hypothetical protein
MQINRRGDAVFVQRAGRHLNIRGGEQQMSGAFK